MRENQVTSWAEKTLVPGCPGQALAGMWPTASFSTESLAPSRTGATSPSEGASSRPRGVLPVRLVRGLCARARARLRCRAQAGRPVCCGCGDRPARTMYEAGAVDRGVVEEPSELRHDHGPSDDARDAGRDNHEVCPRTAPDLQPAPPVSRFRPMR